MSKINLSKFYPSFCLPMNQTKARSSKKSFVFRYVIEVAMKFHQVDHLNFQIPTLPSHQNKISLSKIYLFNRALFRRNRLETKVGKIRTWPNPNHPRNHRNKISLAKIYLLDPASFRRNRPETEVGKIQTWPNPTIATSVQLSLSLSLSLSQFVRNDHKT